MPGASTVAVQIYGITTVEDAEAVNALRPDNVGIVIDEGIGTWDIVEPGQLPPIRAALADVTVVALSLATDVDRVLRTIDETQPHIVHLARASSIGVDEVGELRDRLGDVRVMTTIPVRDETAIEMAKEWSAIADFLLLDSADASGTVGATGLTHDWRLSRAIVEAVETPTFLAGGLGPQNVEAAIEQVRPYGVDSETRTSRTDDRRRKDLALVEDFIRRARASP
jgi:phosphoribosylanthranilate isomerase